MLLIYRSMWMKSWIELFRATAIIEMDGWTHVCWMCVLLFYMLFLFLGKVVDILGCDGILIFEI